MSDSAWNIVGEWGRGHRVALVHDWLNGMRGGEKVLEVVAELFPGADVYTFFLDRERISPALQKLNLIEWGPGRWMPQTRRAYKAFLPVLPRMAASLPTADYDLVLATSHCVAKGAPPPRRGVSLAYVFTPMRYAWNRAGDYADSGMKSLALRVLGPSLRRWDRETARAIDFVAADSRFIADEVAEYWQRQATVIHPPADTEFFTPDNREPDDFVLFVGALVPYKRVDRAIDATRLTGDRLVIVGAGPEEERLRAMAHGRVEFRGWVSPEKLRAAYRRCRALVYPGVEDFGITAVEAMACGRPVVALGRGGACDTVLPGVSGVLFEEASARGLADALTSLRGGSYPLETVRAHAESFSMDRFREALGRWIHTALCSRSW